MEFCDKESLLLFSLSSSRCLWAIDLIVTTIICRQWFQLKWFLAMIWPWLLFDYYHPKSSKSRFAQCFQWFCNHSEKAGNLVENRTILENAAFYQDAPENSDVSSPFGWGNPNAVDTTGLLGVRAIFRLFLDYCLTTIFKKRWPAFCRLSHRCARSSAG